MAGAWAGMLVWSPRAKDYAIVSLVRCKGSRGRGNLLPIPATPPTWTWPANHETAQTSFMRKLLITSITQCPGVPFCLSPYLCVEGDRPEVAMVILWFVFCCTGPRGQTKNLEGWFWGSSCMWDHDRSRLWQACSIYLATKEGECAACPALAAFYRNVKVQRASQYEAACLAAVQWHWLQLKFHA